MFCAFAQVLKKPIVKPPADDLGANEAAEVAWNNHKMRNQSLMVELFDVSLWKKPVIKLFRYKL